MGDNQRDEDVFSDTLSNRGDLEALVNPQGAGQSQPRESRVHRSGFTSGLNPALLGGQTNLPSGSANQNVANVRAPVVNVRTDAERIRTDTGVNQMVNESNEPSLPRIIGGEAPRTEHSTPLIASRQPSRASNPAPVRLPQETPVVDHMDEEQGRPREAHPRPRQGETVEELLGRLIRESQASRSSRDQLPVQQTVIIKKEKVKINELEDLTGRHVRIFLSQVRAALSRGQDINLSNHIHAIPLEQILCDCPDVKNESILAYLEALDEEEKSKAMNEPLVLIRTRLKWSDKKDMTIEEKCKDFIRNLKLHMKDIGSGAQEGTLNRERVMQEVVKMLPAGLMISADTVTFNKRYQTANGLAQLIEHRLPLLHQKHKTINRLEAGPMDQTGYLANRVQKLEQQATYDQNNYLINKVQQLEKQVVVNRQAEAMPKPQPTYAVAARQGQAVTQPPAVAAQPVVAQNSTPMKDRNLGIGNKTPFNGICWNCNQRGHRAEDCPLPETELFKQNLEKFRQMRAEIRNVNTEHSQRCQIEVLSANGTWNQVTGCLDSGSDSNVAPESLKQYANQVSGMKGYTYRLPNGDEVTPKYRGMMTVRIQVDGKPVDLGNIPFHFLSHPLWDQVLVGRPTLAKMNILPEQNVMRMMNNQGNTEREAL